MRHLNLRFSSWLAAVAATKAQCGLASIGFRSHYIARRRQNTGPAPKGRYARMSAISLSPRTVALIRQGG